MSAPSPVRNTGYVSGTSVSSLTASFGALPTVGNGIVACVGTFVNNAAETWTFSDNQTNTYSNVVNGQSGTGGTAGNHVGVAVGYCGATTRSAGTFSAKVSLSAAHTSGFIAFEASSALTVDQTTLTQVVGSTGPRTVNSSTTSVTTQANELCVASFAADDTTVSAASGEWTATAGSTAVATPSPAPTTTFSFFAAYSTTTSSGVTATVGATNANTGNVEPVAAIATFYAAGGSTTTIAPSKGALVLAGHAPGLQASLLPSVGHLALAGHAPGITETLLPAAGHLTLTGHAPALSFGIRPTAGHLVLTGYAPSMPSAATPIDWIRKQRRRHRR